MARDPTTVRWTFDEAVIKATVIESYYLYLVRADLNEFTDVVHALEILPKHVRPVYFRATVRSRLNYIVSYAVKHKNFRSFFVYYFAPSINKWI